MEQEPITKDFFTKANDGDISWDVDVLQATRNHRKLYAEKVTEFC